MRKTIKYLLAFALSITVSSIYIAGCSGTGTSGADSGRSINMGGVVMAPVVSDSISAPPSGKSISKAVSEESVSGITCSLFTLEGEDLGSLTTSSDGTFTISVDLETLKGSEDTGTTWTEPVVLACDNGIELYAEVSVDESALADIDIGTANMTTTLSASSFAQNIEGFSGWGSSYKDDIEGFNATCLLDAINALWDNADPDNGGLADDSSYLKDAITGFIASGGTPAQLGYSDWATLLNETLSGAMPANDFATMAAAAAEYLGVSSDTLTAGYDDAHDIFGAINGLFATQFSTGGYGLNICGDLEGGNIDPNAFIQPLLAASDLDSFNATYSGDGIVVHFGLLEECLSASDCSDLSGTPNAYFGFMYGYGGDFSEVWTGSEFNSDALGGMLIAPPSCEGNTAESIMKCAEALNKTVYSGAGGDWDQFKTDGTFDANKFAFWGGYYTGLASTGTFDPSSVDYSSVWSDYFEGTSDETTLQEVVECVNSKVASGNYDTTTCFADVSSATVTSVPTEIIGTYSLGNETDSSACNFTSTANSVQVQSYTETSYTITIYFEEYGLSPPPSYVFTYDTGTGTFEYSNESVESIHGKIYSVNGVNKLIFTSASLTGETCSVSATPGKVFTIY